jgi:dolichol kinase
MADMAVVTVTQAIQQSVAPVFLLAGIAGILNVLTSRLSRIIDRSRALHLRLDSASEDRKSPIQGELVTLTRRGRVVHRAIAYGTGSALLVCLVIALLFVSAIMGWNNSVAIALLFILAMGFLIAALCGFLREIQLATRVMLNGP